MPPRFALTLDTPEDVEGLPPSLLQLAAQAARQAGAAQPRASMAVAHHPGLSELWPISSTADVVTCASSCIAPLSLEPVVGEENTPLLALFSAYGRNRRGSWVMAVSPNLAPRQQMAPDVATVERFEELRQASFTAAQHDLEDLRTVPAAGAAEAEDLCHWDLAFWAERLREQRYDFNDEELRRFSAAARPHGLFTLAQRLFGVQIRPADGEAPVWHEDVRFFRVYDDQERPIAAFILTRTADREARWCVDG